MRACKYTTDYPDFQKFFGYWNSRGKEVFLQIIHKKRIKMKTLLRRICMAASAVLLASMPLIAQEVEYCQPSQEIVDVVMSRPLPEVILTRDLSHAAVATREHYFTPVAEIAATDEYKVAGVRLNGANFGHTRKTAYTGLSILDMLTGASVEVRIPEGAKMREFAWSPSGRYLCFLNETPDEIELYRVDATAEAPEAVKINTRKVNATLTSAFAFLDDETILYRSVPDDLGAFPVEEAPKGPVLQSSVRKQNTFRTYQDLLKSPYDEAVFEYLCSSVFTVFDGTQTRTFGGKSIVRDFTVSPDGQYMMLTTEHKPYSYAKTHSSFPSRLEICDMQGNVLKVLRKNTPDKDVKKDAPKKDEPRKDIPKEKKPTKSSYEWRADKGAVLTWIETLPSEDKDNDEDRPPFPPADDEDKDKDKPERTYYTSLWQCGAPFDLDNDKQLVLTAQYRLGDVIWGNDNIAIYTESSQKQKISRTLKFNPSDTAAGHTLLRTIDTSLDTTGGRPVPGSFYTVRKGATGRVLLLDKKGTSVLLTGSDRRGEDLEPMSFIDRMYLKDGRVENIWTAKAPFKETIRGIVNPEANKFEFISLRESFDVVPNYVRINVRRGKEKVKPITAFENPIPHFDQIRREFITYERPDGVRCAGQIFLPADYDPERDGRLPVFLWTYPYEHKSVARAEYHHRPTRYDFCTPATSRQFFWALKGYAVVLGWSMPIIAEKNNGQPNDAFQKNLIMNAEAIINHLDSIGIGDRNRMAVGGHSYGGFMTGNLLALTRLFKVGIANSGAYNRTLTPYGFQSEGRDYWKAQEVYTQMSPYNNAHKVKDAILLTNGMMDENTGTHPIQSERFYYAIAGHNGTAKWLQLPYEGHGYRYQENVLHYYYEVENMFEKYLKNAKPAKEKTEEAKDDKN